VAEPGFIPFQDMIAAHAASAPDGIAFSVDDNALSWQVLHGRVTQVAGALAASGVEPGDMVAVLGLPSLAYVECLFGIVAARACVVPLPVSASTDTLEVMLADCGAKLLFLDPATGDDMARMAAQWADRRSGQLVHFGDDGSGATEYVTWRAHASSSGAASSRATRQAHPDDAFNIIYSSGTTGMPKGIVHLHGMRQKMARRGGFGFGSHSRTLLSTPMYSNTTITPMIGTLAHGGECMLMRKFDAGRFLAIATARRATHTMLVPVQYKRVLAHPDFERRDLSAFVLSQSTGAPMDVALKREIVTRWPGRFREIYGMTEGGVSCALDAQTHPDKLGTVGRPVQGTEVFLIDESGKRLPNAVDSVGEIVGRSLLMMAGYHNRPDANHEIRWYDDEGRLHHRSGDIGRFDADGFLTLLDRRKDVIISGGNNIYATDLEAVLMRHADVQDCAVIGVPSEQWGESPMALVTAKPGAQIDAEALREWVNAQVGKTQRLVGIEVRDALPRSALGKLSKKELRAPYWKKADTT
jgi:acyl-CoA synthetase (AMP-forming)/AMP-acid ligase II